jgi:hypothetical protein
LRVLVANQGKAIFNGDKAALLERFPGVFTHVCLVAQFNKVKDTMILEAAI